MNMRFEIITTNKSESLNRKYCEIIAVFSRCVMNICDLPLTAIQNSKVDKTSTALETISDVQVYLY